MGNRAGLPRGVTAITVNLVARISRLAAAHMFHRLLRRAHLPAVLLRCAAGLLDLFRARRQQGQLIDAAARQPEGRLAAFVLNRPAGVDAFSGAAVTCAAPSKAEGVVP